MNIKELTKEVTKNFLEQTLCYYLQKRTYYESYQMNEILTIKFKYLFFAGSLESGYYK